MSNLDEMEILYKAQKEFGSFSDSTVLLIAELDGDTARRELARYEYERRQSEMDS